jgi:8-oxo-dGTP pyrophosphatase MutT (NUDIX family)
MYSSMCHLLLLERMSDQKTQYQADQQDITVFSGKIGEVIHSKQQDGRVFERYRRPPGVRLVIVSSDKTILITKEHRNEAGGVDLRLPGGKVCDSLEAYHTLLSSGQDIIAAAKDAAKKEALEETGLIIENPFLLATANAGATVEWDLYYFLVDAYTTSPQGQQLEDGETIEVTWMTIDQIRHAIEDGQIKEWRSVGVLLGKVLPKLLAT